MSALRREDLVVNKEYLYRNYKSYDDLGHNLNRKKKRKSGGGAVSKDKVNSYVSPFIQQSREKALARAREDKRKLLLQSERQMKRPWNDDFAKQTIDCFDGRGKSDKAVIFKREPRIPPGKEKNQSEENSVMRMTRRRNKDDIPLMPSRMAGWNEPRTASPNARYPNFISSYPPHSSPDRNELQIEEPSQHESIPSPTQRTPAASSPAPDRFPSFVPSSDAKSHPISHPPPPPTQQYSASRSVDKQSSRTSPYCQSAPPPPSPQYPNPSPAYRDSPSHCQPTNSQSNPYLPEFYGHDYDQPEVIRVKTRGTSPFSSADFDKLFSSSGSSNPSSAGGSGSRLSGSRPSPPAALIESDGRGRERQPHQEPNSTHREQDLERLTTLRLLESQSKAQEVNGEMISKFTTLLTELGKIITHRETPVAASALASQGRGSAAGTGTRATGAKSKAQTLRAQKRVFLQSPPSPLSASSSPPSLSQRPSDSRQPSSAVRNRAHGAEAVVGVGAVVRKKSNRSHREEVLDHILQRLQVFPSPSPPSCTSHFFGSSLLSSQLMESQEAAISDTLLLKTVSSAAPSPLSTATATAAAGDSVSSQRNQQSKEKEQGKEQETECIPPLVSQTFEISADILTLAEVGSGWLLPDGRDEKRSAVGDRDTPLPIGSSRGRGLISVRAPPPLKHDLLEYQREFKRASQLKEAVFRHHHTSQAEVVDSLTEHLMECLLEEAAEELDQVFTDLAEKFVDKV